VKDIRGALSFSSRGRWRSWLTRNHSIKREALLIVYKRAPKNKRFPSRVALEEALCFGWIDGWFKPIDEDRWVIRYTPRRKGSNWSRYNIATAWNLLNDGRMTKAGIAELPEDVLEVWKRHKPKATIVIGVAQGGIKFADGRDYLSMIKMPSKGP
jgi:uncharacterized protein YdeI (YjbR/CyaY-like superfamily)